LHEVQHAVQEREGFARGGSPEQFVVPYSSVEPLYEAGGKLVSLQLDALRKNKSIAEMANAALANNTKRVSELKKMLTPDEVKDALQLYRDVAAIGKEYNLVTTNIDDMSNQLIKRADGVEPFDQYQRLAGEAEARNVETRMNMSMDERRATPPWKTLDVPESELIVRGGSGKAMSVGDDLPTLKRELEIAKASEADIIKPLQDEYRNPNTSQARKDQILGEVRDIKKGSAAISSQIFAIERKATSPAPIAPKETKPPQTFSGKVYHQTSESFDDFDFNKSADGTVWFTQDKASFSDPSSAASAASGKGRIIEKEVNLKKVAGWEEMDRYTIDELVQQGYDGAVLDGDVQVFNSKAISSGKAMSVGDELKAAREAFDAENPGFGEDMTSMLTAPQRVREADSILSAMEDGKTLRQAMDESDIELDETYDWAEKSFSRPKMEGDLPDDVGYVNFDTTENMEGWADNAIALELGEVNSKYRGKGYGRALFEREIGKVLNEHPNRPISLLAQTFDEGAEQTLGQSQLVRFYESLGFGVDDIDGDLAGTPMTLTKRSFELAKKKRQSSPE